MAFTLRLARLAVVLSLSLLVPAVAHAGEPQRGVWIVSTATAPMGTLTLRDGKLIYRTTSAANSWEIDLSDAKRVELSKTTAGAIEIENGWGNTYVIKILNARLTPESPSKAFKTISAALNDSVKVVRVNGSQVR
jgi:hypothetical protein